MIFPLFPSLFTQPRPGSNSFIRPGATEPINFFEYSKRAIQPLDNDMKQNTNTSIFNNNIMNTVTAPQPPRQQHQRSSSVILQRLRRDESLSLQGTRTLAIVDSSTHTTTTHKKQRIG